MEGDTQVAQLLAAMSEGEEGVLDRLFPLVYEELHRLAHGQVRRLGPGQTLDTTALLHEAYLELCGRPRTGWNDRNHFVAVAATVMRHLLVDNARAKAALKRGGDLSRAPLEGLAAATPAPVEDLLALDEALAGLHEIDPRLVRLVEMRFFGGLTETEIADVLEMSESTVKRDWRKAKALLFRMLSPPAAEAVG